MFADSFEIRLAYLVYIFRQLNTLNLELQGKGSLIIGLVDKIKAFIRKMENWRRKVGMGNLAMLDTMCSSTLLQSALKYTFSHIYILSHSLFVLSADYFICNIYHSFIYHFIRSTYTSYTNQHTH